MKLIKKFLGIIAIIAVIGFMVLPLTGCPDEESLPPPPPPPPPKSTPTAADFDIHGLTHKYEADITEYKVTITPKAGKSTGTITAYYEGTDGKDYAKSTNAPSDLGKYAVTFDVAAADGWNPASGLTAGTMLVTDTLFTPEAGHFDITGISVTYDGSPKSVTITAQEGKTEGTVTIYYEGTGSTTYTKSATAPTNAGTYAVTFDVSESDAWTAVTGLSKGTLTINKATPVLGDYDLTPPQFVTSVNNIAVPVTVKTTGLRSDGAVTVYCEGTNGTPYTKKAGKPDKVGTFTVTFDVAGTGNWNAATNFSAGTLEINVFKAIADLGTWLGQQTENAAATAYPVALNVGSFGTNATDNVGSTLKNNNTKFVSLDLSGSNANSLGYITTIPPPPGVEGSPTTTTAPFFDSCNSLVSVTIPNTVSTLPQSAFARCTSLASITIPNSVTTIGQYAFNSCTSLPAITIPNSVTSIGQNTFDSCTSLASITFEATSKVTSIGDKAFFGCTSLASITIPNSVTRIGGDSSIKLGAFNNCTKLSSVTLPTNASFTSIEDNTFYGCSSLASITIPASVTSIGNSAFGGTGLTSVTIPASVTSIGQSAFGMCNSLTSVTFATGSNIPDANFGTNAFPPNDYDGVSLKGAYYTGKAGTYTRPNTSSADWTKQP